MQRPRQSFHNGTDRPQFINPGTIHCAFSPQSQEELILFYDADEVQDEQGAALRIEFVPGGDGIELCVWTAEVEMFFLDGRPAPLD